MKNFIRKHRTAAATLVVVLCLNLSAALTNTYDTASPAPTDDPRFADDRMREIKAAVQERMNDHNGETDEGDHFWPLDGTETTQVLHVDTGQHRMVTLRQMSGNPSDLTSYSSITNLGFLYQKNIGSNGELFWEDETGVNVLQLTTNGLFNLNSAIWDGVFATSTSDAGDSKSVSLTSGGAYGASRGAGIILYGNQHANKGQLVLEAGYTDDPTNTVKAIIDVKTSKISNVADPAAAQDAVTKAYLESKIGTGAMSPIPYAGGESITLSNGLIMKMGYIAGASPTVTFGVAFPTAIKSLNYNPVAPAGTHDGPAITAIAATGFTLNSIGVQTGYYWTAIGY